MNKNGVVTPEEFTPSRAKAEGMRVLRHPKIETCAVFGNIEYIERSGKKLHIQILRPATDRLKKPSILPLIVYVPGSAWHKQNVYMNIPRLSGFAMRGFVIAIVEYRESDIAPFPAQVQDCKTAIRFLKASGDQHGIDVNNIALWGCSSGGHTVLMAGITGDGILDTPDYAEHSSRVNSVINFYGPTNVAKMCEYPSIMEHVSAESPEGFLLGKVPVLENPEKVRAASPESYISPDKACPPILTMHGDSDMIVPFEQSIIIHEALSKAGKHSEFYKLAGADHGSGEFWSNETFDVVEKFIRKFNT